MGGQQEAGGSGPEGEGGQAVNTAGVFCSLKAVEEKEIMCFCVLYLVDCLSNGSITIFLRQDLFIYFFYFHTLFSEKNS